MAPVPPWRTGPREGAGYGLRATRVGEASHPGPAPFSDLDFICRAARTSVLSEAIQEFWGRIQRIGADRNQIYMEGREGADGSVSMDSSSSSSPSTPKYWRGRRLRHESEASDPDPDRTSTSQMGWSEIGSADGDSDGSVSGHTWQPVASDAGDFPPPEIGRAHV